MKLVVYLPGDTSKRFPAIAEMTRQGVEVLAVRTGPNMVRYALTAPFAGLSKYLETASRYGIRHTLEARRAVS